MNTEKGKGRVSACCMEMGETGPGDQPGRDLSAKVPLRTKTLILGADYYEALQRSFRDLPKFMVFAIEVPVDPAPPLTPPLGNSALGCGGSLLGGR